MRHHVCAFVAVVSVCACLPFLNAQPNRSNNHPIRIATISDSTEQSSADMMKSFRSKIASHSNLFALVSNLDDSPGLLLLAACIIRDTPTDGVRSYTSQ